MSDDNLKRMKTLDDAWYSQDWEVFRKRHAADTAVYWPGQPEPTRGRDPHQAESEASRDVDGEQIPTLEALDAAAPLRVWNRLLLGRALYQAASELRSRP